MALTAKNSGSGDFETCPAGIQSAVCYAVADIGWQPNPYAEAKPHHQAVVLFESEHRMQDGRRFGLSKFYTISLHEKAALRKDLIAWRGKDFTKEELDAGFDLEKLQGANCTLNVVHESKPDGSVRAKIAGIMPPMRDKPKLIAENKGVPEWVEKKAMSQVADPYANKQAAPVQQNSAADATSEALPL